MPDSSWSEKPTSKGSSESGLSVLNKYDYIFLTGDPGSGKSTMARDMSEQTGWPVLSTGDAIRKAGLAASLKDGDFGPDAIVLEAVMDFLVLNPHGIIDGYPRRPHQVAELMGMREATGKRMLVLFCMISAEDAINRYLDRGFKRSKNGNIGPAGEKDAAGDPFDLPDVGEYYLLRRSKQKKDIRETCRLLGSGAFDFKIHIES